MPANGEETMPGTGSQDRFRPIANRYDLANRLLSLGLDGWWRGRAVAALSVTGGSAVLDMCCGTGDLALSLAATSLPAVVAGIDISSAMLEQARIKLSRLAMPRGPKAPPVVFVRGDVALMPFPDSGFDAAIVGFGLRNVPDRAAALRETRRVLSGHGRLVVLEFVPPGRGLMPAAARLWIERAVPWVGGILGGERGAYEYLRDSVLAFPSPDRIAAEIVAAGFASVRFELLFPGVVCVWTAEKERAPAKAAAPGT